MLFYSKGRAKSGNGGSNQTGLEKKAMPAHHHHDSAHVCVCGVRVARIEPHICQPPRLILLDAPDQPASLQSPISIDGSSPARQLLISKCPADAHQAQLLFIPLPNEVNNDEDCGLLSAMGTTSSSSALLQTPCKYDLQVCGLIVREIIFLNPKP
jgi:hypothetical protein